MRFNGPLDASTQDRVEACNHLLNDPDRLAALAKTGLLDSEPERAFDRLAHLAGHLLKVPLTIISLVSGDKQFFKAGFGLPAPYDVKRAIPVAGSICRYTLDNMPLVVPDARCDPLLQFHPATEPWGIIAFMAIPMTTDTGHVLGAFCAVDYKVRPWSEDEVMILRELTASVMTEVNLRSQITQLQAERSLRELFVTTLTHDLRGPLSVMRSLVDLIAEPSTNATERASYLESICDNIDRSDRMIQDLLTANRKKFGTEGAAKTDPTTLQNEKMALGPLLTMTIEALRKVYKRDFVLDLRAQVPGLWDADGLRRIIENLVGNAVKYGLAATPITIALSREASGVNMSVHNQGTPISPSEQKTLFGMFQRSAAALAGSQSGWGIGLSVVQALTQELGGRLSLESTAEAGTTFAVHLPMQI